MTLLIYHKPLQALLLIPILISFHITSLTLVKVVSVTSIFLFSLGNIFILKNDFYELWAICIYLVFYLLFKAKNFNLKEENEKIKADEEFIYDREFKNDFNYDEFMNILFKNSEVKKFRKKFKLFTSEGGPFDKIYYFIKIPVSSYVTLRHQKIVISYLKESSWIGVVEFITQFFDDTQRKWMIGLDFDNPNEDELVWMEWDKDVSELKLSGIIFKCYFPF